MILLDMNKQDTCPSFTSVRFPKPEMFVEMFRRNLQSLVWKRQMCTNNSENIWKLLWLSRRLIIFTEQTSIYINTFSNAPTSKKATNHEIGIYFSTNAIVALCHAPP